MYGKGPGVVSVGRQYARPVEHASSLCHIAVVVQAMGGAVDRGKYVSFPCPDVFQENTTSQKKEQAATAASSQMAHRTLRLARSG